MPVSFHRDAVFFHRVRGLRQLSHFPSPTNYPDHRSSTETGVHVPELNARNATSSLRYAAHIALLAAIYFLAGRLGFLASAVHPVVSSAWPPSGIALAALLLFGMRLWPGIAIGAFVVNVTGGIAPLAAATIALGNSLEGIVGAWLLTSVAAFRTAPEPLGRLRDVLALVVFGAILSTPVAATVGVTVLTVFGGAPAIPYGTAWLAWWTGDAIGILLVTPLILTWVTGPRLRIAARDAAEAGALSIVLVVFTVVLFQAPFSYVYAIFPVTMWAALRFGPRAAATASFVVTALAIWYTVGGVGPFATSTAAHNLFQLQTFISLLAITTMILAGVIAERRTAEAAIVGARQQHHDIIHYASVGVIQTDREGNILLANPALATILGYDGPEQLVGRNVVDDVYWDETQHAAIIARYDLLADGAALEVQWKRKDGSPTWVDLQARAVKDTEGRSVYLEGFVYDLTARKHLERQFQQSQKMEAVGRLAGGVAHDFNNLLTVIASCTDFVLDDPTLAEAHRDDLGEVKKATGRASSLTRQLLAFGRTQVLHPQTIDLNDRLTELLPMLKRLFETTIDIGIETTPDLWAVRADPGQIEQVLLNLAINARDAMPEGGALTFSTENSVIAAEPADLKREYTMRPGDYVLLTVKDTGVGMTDETQRKIFEPFFTTKEVGKGTGLGLATAYGIIKQSGGYIKVRSAAGEGTDFLIYLPRTDAAPEKMLPSARRNGSPATGTVLLVEDETAVRRALQRILITAGYTVIPAADGADALELFLARKGDIDILITDLVMPGMGGRELARQCSALRDTLKVIYLSGYTRDSLLSQETFEEGTEFIEKPFTREAILDRISRVLRT
jgi:PAS domain S-box-containing protein